MAQVQSKLSPDRKNGSGKKPPIKKVSPKKNSSKMNNRPRFTLSVVGFHPDFPLEAYFYRRSDGRDGYTQTYRQAVDNQRDIPSLDENGFIQYFARRNSIDDDNTMMGSDNWACYVLVRWIPNQDPSTAETRREGLQFLRGFFMSSEYSRYPPNDINTIDITDTENPVPMDHFFQDQHIINFIPAIYPEEVANTTFFSSYPDEARMFFSRDEYPADAIALYGYGRAAESEVANIGQYEAGFNPGIQAGEDQPAPVNGDKGLGETGHVAAREQASPVADPQGPAETAQVPTEPANDAKQTKGPKTRRK